MTNGDLAYHVVVGGPGENALFILEGAGAVHCAKVTQISERESECRGNLDDG